MNSTTENRENELLERAATKSSTVISKTYPDKMEQPQLKERILTRTETAAMLKISLVTLHNRMKDHSLPSRRLGRRVYFLESEILSSLK
jgi:predicted DNA-binding transcriptional regulator AlpA